ncbi:BRCT domain-containing protein [Vibrio fluvialis]|uniref:BRCT domain-containing protein n=1 Tax=Vibrio fluvialis TaxID=676 RepID=UPI003D7D8DE3
MPDLKSEITIDVPPKRQNHSNIGFEVCVSGFDKDKRAALEEEAKRTGMIVRTNMTKKLTVLCVGPNAGPAKFEQALKDDILIMTEDEFFSMLSAGVLQPPPSEDRY